MRYVAMLRGVSPMNCKMAELKAAFEKAGFTDVKTVLSSGNVVFSANKASEAAIEKKCEAAMKKYLGRSFYTIVRSRDTLRDLLETDAWKTLKVARGAKQVVTFSRTSPVDVPLPIKRDGAIIHALFGREVFTSYVKHPKGPVFMGLIEKAFGDTVTTRTWETVKKLAR